MVVEQQIEWAGCYSKGLGWSKWVPALMSLEYRGSDNNQVIIQANIKLIAVTWALKTRFAVGILLQTVRHNTVVGVLICMWQKCLQRKCLQQRCLRQKYWTHYNTCTMHDHTYVTCHPCLCHHLSQGWYSWDFNSVLE